jgi:hypothetical protein
MGVIYRCGSEQRREKVLNSDTCNGIDCVEVMVPSRLTLTFLKDNPRPALTPDNIIIFGTAQSAPVQVKEVIPKGQKVSIELYAPGDLSTYTLRLRKPNSAEPPEDIDPRLAEVDFTFRPEPPADLKTPAITAPLPAEPEINYLAKDYASFRSLMLDRISMLLPGGIEEQPADLQVALVELLAYTADRLSYYQDAVATEAYLGTALSRASLRRHARLLNYKVHEGCNARVWISCEVSKEATVGVGWQFLTEGTEPVIFKPCHYPNLYPQNNSFDFYSWGDDDYRLQYGTTHATLLQNPPDQRLCLKPGDLLLLEASGQDADIALRHVVRLTEVQEGEDPVEKKKVVEVAWGAEDALPFDLPVRLQMKDIAVARGNIVLADHGRSIDDQKLMLAPSRLGLVDRLALSAGPLTYAEPLAPDLLKPKEGGSLTSAAGLLRRDVRAALPLIKLEGDDDVWLPRYDLLERDGMKADFVVETEEDGSAFLRFGNGIYGRRPAPGATFTASYRLGNGRIGNVGTEMICRGKGTNTKEVVVRNPLPARGGEDPEPAEQVRLFAPQAFRTQKRAITAADYGNQAQCFPDVQRAAADIRWTGSWYTVYLFVDRLGGRELDDDFKRRLLSHMEGYHLAGYDMEIRKPAYVLLDIELRLEVKPGFVANAVIAAVKDALSNRDLANGRRGYFHPDNWTLGQSVYLSKLYSAALSVTGVGAINATKFMRLGVPETLSREQGEIVIGPHEVVQLENAPTISV